MTLWTSSEIAQATKGEAQGEFAINGISIDSREIAEGDLFVALKAARDGHEFVKMALDKGASGALVSHVPEGCEDARLVVVNDVEEALEAMGRARRAEVSGQLVAVTGSAGKTSTKEMLRHVFESFGRTHASMKSFNNHWGVPLTLARMPKDTEFGVFEIGMNAPGEIEPLVKMVRPDVAVITNVAAVHLAGFENEDGIALEKSAIMKGLSDDGLALVFGDMRHIDFVRTKAQTELQVFGRELSNDIVLSSERQADGSGFGTVRIAGQDHDFQVPVSGAHHLQNALIVFGTAQRFGLDLNKVAQVLSTWQAPSGRGAKYQVGNFVIVDESYNANPLSMKAAISSFVSSQQGRKVAVLGVMNELGEDSARLHAEIAKIPELAEIDIVHCVGSDMRHLFDKLGVNQGNFFETKDIILDQKNELFQEGDAVLFKASNSVGLGQVVDALRNLGDIATKNQN